MIGKIRKYYREGNLALALKLKLNIYFDKWIAASEKQKLGSKFVNRFYVRNEAEAVRFFFSKHNPGETILRRREK